MKASLIFCLMISFCMSLSAQRKFTVGLELSYGVSQTTIPDFFFIGERGLLSGRNAFLTGGYKIIPKVEVSLGVGYLVTRQSDQFTFGFTAGHEYTETFHTHQYLVVPVGARFHFGSFYIHPEFGLGFSEHHDNTVYEYHFEPNQTSIIGSGFEETSEAYNRITTPVFLSVGNELKLGSVKLIVGIRGYYSLNAISSILQPTGHYYGVGIVTGVKF